MGKALCAESGTLYCLVELDQRIVAAQLFSSTGQHTINTMNNWSTFFWKFLKFGVVGASGVVVDFGITWLLKEKLKLNQYVANSTGFACAVVSNYILNRIWTFEDHNPDVAVQFAKFTAIALVGLALNNAIIYVLNERLRMNFYVSKLIATGVVMLWNFGANYTFTFGG